MTVSLSGRTGRTSGILMASSCGSPGGLLIPVGPVPVAGGLRLGDMQYAGLLPFVLDLGEFDGQQAVVQPRRPLVGVDRREEMDLAAEAAVAAFHAEELDALRPAVARRGLGARQRDLRATALDG